MLIFANPSDYPQPAKASRRSKPKQEAATMAKKHRSPAQKAATRRMLAANRSSKKRHRNPTAAPRKATRRRSTAARHRNPSRSYSGGKSVLKELLSMEGAIMVGAAVVTPTILDEVQKRLMPTATGWTRIGIKAVTAGVLAYALDKWGKQRKAALAVAVVGAGNVLAEAVRFYRGTSAGAPPAVADYIATDSKAFNAMMDSNALGSYEAVLSDSYSSQYASNPEDQSDFQFTM